MNNDKFFNDYIICALWSSIGDDGEPLDEEYDIDDIAPESLESMRADCDDFVRAVENAGIEFESERAGHDFWLTRNGHGAGYWDGDYPVHGDTLTAMCKAYGSSDLYVGDDGKLYVS